MSPTEGLPALLWPVSDRAMSPTEGLPADRGDLRSDVSAGSGDPRLTCGDPRQTLLWPVSDRAMSPTEGLPALLWPVSDRAMSPTEGLPADRGDLRSDVSAGSGDPRLTGRDPRLTCGDPRLTCGDPRLTRGDARQTCGFRPAPPCRRPNRRPGRWARSRPCGQIPRLPSRRGRGPCPCLPIRRSKGLDN